MSVHDYDGGFFFATALRLKGSALKEAAPRAAVVSIAAIAATLMHIVFPGRIVFSDVILEPFYVMVALLLAFRLDDAYRKWERASRLSLDFHARTRGLVTRACAYTSRSHKDPGCQELLLDFRRLMILTLVLIKKHVRNDPDDEYDDEVVVGLMTAAEQAKFQAKTTRAVTDGKMDRFPSRNRPALVLQRLHCIAIEMTRVGYLEAHAWNELEGELARFGNLFEDVDHLSITLLPFPYAQMTRLVALAFLVSLPFEVGEEMGLLTIPMAFCVNLMVFALDECAAQMETPFGDRKYDVDLLKMIRRADKHSASLLGSHLDTVVDNFDLFAITRSTTVSFKRTSRKQYDVEIRAESGEWRVEGLAWRLEAGG